MQLFVRGVLLGMTLLSALSHATEVLTPERLLSAPRPGSGVVNPAGTRALVGVKTFSFKNDRYDTVLYHLNLPSSHDLKDSTSPPELNVISKDTASGIWLSDDVAAHVDSKSNTLYAKDVSTNSDDSIQSWTTVGTFPAPVDTLQITKTGKGRATLVFSAQVYGDGELHAVKKHDESEAVKEWDRVKVYDSGFVRHWDRWLFPGKRTQLFSVDLNVDGELSSWSFSSDFRNLLKGTTLEAPVPPFGDEGDFSVSSSHVVFTSKDPDLNPSWHTKQNIYLVDIKGASPPIKLSKGKHGATSSPAFSPDGKRVAWLQMERDGFEADKRIIHVTSIEGDSNVEITEVAKDWFLSPSTVLFSLDGESLMGVVEEAEQIRIYQVAVDDSSSKGEIKMLSKYGGIGSLTPVEQGFFVSASSLESPTDLFLVTPHASHSKKLGTKALRLTNFGQSKGSSLAGLDLGRHPEQFNFPGARNRISHSWIHFPPGYDDSKTYPLAVLIHGGPEGAWTNSWSYRWNPAVFAAKEFFVITIDPAGSTGFGQEYQEEILGQWGGAPFLDIRAGVKHILSQYSNVDPERVVAAGASYGGFMMNWINGHNEDKLFKGLVCHDGVFSTLSTFYATEELYFPEFEFGGVPWNARKEYQKWSPEQFTQNWETPQLTIAGGKDYRLPESEGISVFNTLQRRGISSRLIYFPNENHWVLEPKNSLKWHEEVLGWLVKYSAPATSVSTDDADVPPSLVFQ